MSLLGGHRHNLYPSLMFEGFIYAPRRDTLLWLGWTVPAVLQAFCRVGE